MTLSIEKHLQLPEWMSCIKTSAMEKSLSRMREEKLISFALGLPAVELFPRELYQRIIHEVIHHEEHAFQYSPTTQELKLHIVKLMQLRGVQCKEDQILLTAGAQQGINLLVRLLMEPGEKVILEELVYPGALQAIQAFSPVILTVGTHAKTGIDVEAVETILKKEKKIRFIYVVSEGGNPHAVSIEESKRIHLARLANEYGVPIIEDDPYGFVTYEHSTPPIKHYGDEWVFYVGSFSKIFAPSFRVGWLVVPEQLISKLSSLKECTDINTMTFTQHVIKKLLDSNIFQSQLNTVRAAYARKRDCMIQALAVALPDGATFHKPTSGIFLWVDFPQHVNTTVMLDTALEKANVAFIPSVAFCATDNVCIQNGMRLNFSHPSESNILMGIERLKEIFHQEFS